METQPLDAEFAALDEQIRKEAERKMQAIRVVAAAHKTLSTTRDEFARADAANRKALTDALVAARSAGFSEADLKRWQADDSKSRRRGPQRRSRTTTQQEHSVTPPETGSADTSPRPADTSFAASA